MKSKYVYMDYAATTPVDSRVEKSMQKYRSMEFGNPSSIHSMGVIAKRAVEDSRKKVAEVLDTSPEEIVFTSGGTEGDNMAIFGVARSVRERYKDKYNHIITTAIEHHAVSSPCRALEREGFEVTYLPVSSDGIVDPDNVKRAIRPDTFLVSVMYANNEIGTIQPIAEIAKVIRRCRLDGGFAIKSGTKLPLLHTDACQAPGSLPLNVLKMGVDLMTISGSKIYGPKGVGALYVKSGTEILPILYGGGQERGLRSGTENVASIVGFAVALELSEKMREKEGVRLGKLRDYFAKSILKIVPGSEVNGTLDSLGAKLPKKRLPNNLNIFVPHIDNEQLVIELDALGVAVSAGSACNSNESTGSHVIWALYHDIERNKGSIRFTLGRSTTKKDVDFILRSLPEILGRIKSEKSPAGCGA